MISMMKNFPCIRSMLLCRMHPLNLEEREPSHLAGWRMSPSGFIWNISICWKSIRNGMYEAFFEDFHKAAIPFLDKEVYGRSIYENSSFIASSKNPNKAYHGKGFVARLSGSTIEFISMWKQMMFGSHILSMKNGELHFTPQPAVPAYLIPENGKVSAMLFGKTKVTYQFADVTDYIPGHYEIASMKFIYQNGSVANVGSGVAGEKIAVDVREGLVTSIEIDVR